ncbi:MAG TPA: endolytic transglycosylase MltG [Candidatus Paceibacterota bacterium]|nr:endolytic transglycosylase MltG [Candidatus Paceibacterota bacterium]
MFSRTHIKIKKNKWLSVIAAVVLLVVLGSLVQTRVAPPSDFPVPYQLTVQSGQTLFSISDELYVDHVIRSRRIFEILMIMLGSEHTTNVGEYYFDQPVSVLQVALRISGKQFGIERKKITFPEGFTDRQIAARLAAALPNFDSALFLTLAKGSEGYLFPDTYTFFPSETPDVILTALKNNFTEKLAPLQTAIAASGRSEEQIITMASIIEKEAKGSDDRAIISGILWKRFDEGIPLQVDAPFLYIFNKDVASLTKADLQTNSPYNTYRYKGLPPTPIDNPGMAAIIAALHPTASPYLYYLHDSSGMIHYATTYTEHEANIKKYLK